MSQYNPQWAEQPQFNQPAPQNHGNGWKVALGTIAGAVILGLGITGGLVLGGSPESPEPSVVAVSQSAIPEPDKTVTAAPEPAPTVTVTEKAPTPDDPVDEPTGEVQNANDIAEQYPGCTWKDDSTKHAQVLTDDTSCFMVIGFGGYSGYADERMDAYRNDPETEDFGFFVNGDTWLVFTAYEGDAASVASLYNLDYEAV